MSELRSFPPQRDGMSYVINRLEGQYYAHILSCIKEGVCQLPNNTEIRRILETSIRRPNPSEQRTERFIPNFVLPTRALLKCVLYRTPKDSPQEV